MRLLILAAVAAMALAGCNQGSSGARLPAPQAGVQVPSVQTPPSTPVEQIRITDENRQQVLANITDLLNGYSGNFASGMAAPAGVSDEVTSLQPGTDHVWQITLTANTPYTLVGACDADCSNVDIELIDSRGGVIASDMLPDDYPVVSYTSAEGGTYYARLLMQACTRAPCYTGMRLLTPTGAAAGK